MNGSTRVEVVIEILRAALDARMGLMIRADLTHLDVRLIGRALTPPIAAGLRHELRVIRLSDPLLDPVAAGDLHPTTAARAYGELPWRNSSPRAGCIRIWGCDQVVSLPITGGRTSRCSCSDGSGTTSPMRTSTCWRRCTRWSVAWDGCYATVVHPAQPDPAPGG